MLRRHHSLNVDDITACEQLWFSGTRFLILLNKANQEWDLLAVQDTQQHRFQRLLRYRDGASPYARHTSTWGSSGSARLLSRPWWSRAEMQGSRDADTRAKGAGEGGSGGRGGWKRRLWQIRQRGGRGGMEAGNPAGAPATDETAERPNTQRHVRDTSRFAFCFLQNSLPGRSQTQPTDSPKLRYSTSRGVW